MSGNDGCNAFSSPLSVSADRVTATAHFTAHRFLSTDVTCPDQRGPVGHLVDAVLRDQFSASAQDHQLQLTGADQQVLVFSDQAYRPSTVTFTVAAAATTVSGPGLLDTPTFSLFFAELSLLCLAATVLVVAVALMARARPISAAARLLETPGLMHRCGSGGWSPQWPSPAASTTPRSPTSVPV